MSLTTSEMTPADIRACTCSNDGYGNGDGMWGNNAWWIVILLLFGWGRNGFGGYGGGYGSGASAPCATQADVRAAVDQQTLISKIACVLRTLIAQSADSVVDSTEIVVQRVVQRGECVGDTVGLLVDFANEGLLIDSGANIGLSSTRRRSPSTVAAAIAAETITTPAKQEQDHDPRPIIAEHTVAVVPTAIVAHNGSNISRAHSFRSQTHVDFSFVKIYLCQSHSGLARTSLKSTATNNLLCDL